MARINIEDDFWDDIAKVAVVTGDLDKAIGNAVRFFKFAQTKHKKGKLITEEEFKEEGFLECLLPVFAKQTPSGIQAKGSERHFAWLNQRIEAGRAGGIKSAKRDRDASGRLKSNIHQASTKQIQASSSYSSKEEDIVNSSTNLLVQSKSISPVFDFESLYKKYPRKNGKSRGMKSCLKEIKTQAQFDALAFAIDCYVGYLEKNKIHDQKYIQMFSTFMGSWRDWLDKDAGTSLIEPQNKGLANGVTPEYLDYLFGRRADDPR